MAGAVVGVTRYNRHGVAAWRVGRRLAWETLRAPWRARDNWRRFRGITRPFDRREPTPFGADTSGGFVHLPPTPTFRPWASILVGLGEPVPSRKSRLILAALAEPDTVVWCIGDSPAPVFQPWHDVPLYVVSEHLDMHGWPREGWESR